jgi:WD40-like Beta Propeller Repeat
MIAPPSQATDHAAQVLALFAQARRRRRRRIATAVAGLLLAGFAVAGLSIGGRHHDGPHRVAARARPPAVIVPPDPARFALPDARVAWLDFAGHLHIGAVATGTQHLVRTFSAGAGGSWFVQAGGHLYWPDFRKSVAPIRDYDLATGTTRYLARGESVFTSADGRHLYIVRTDTSVLELRPGGARTATVLSVPAGWTVAPGREWAVAGGVLVYSGHGRGSSQGDAQTAIWDPRTGSVRVVGAGQLIDAAYTAPGARYSLLAWTPLSCGISRNCPIEITNTATLATRTVRSPLRHGFTAGDGAFSPDGKRLAVFARRASLDPSRANRSELAIVSTRTGRLRLVLAARLETQEDAGWAVWLPGSRRLLAGALLYSYAVDATTLAARPFFFFPGAAGTYGSHDIMNTEDINFSAIVLRHYKRRE